MNRHGMPLPLELVRQVYAAQFHNCWGRHVHRAHRRILKLDGKHWFVKYKRNDSEKKKDYLAYLLGMGWTNVAEVRPLSEGEFSDLRSLGIALPRWATNQNTNLIRLADDYRIDELQHQDINAAVASELVFSVWIRRRDTHAANRAYVEEIPVFFDHQTAFGADQSISPVDNFFHDGEESDFRLERAGTASSCRVRLMNERARICTQDARQLGRSEDKAIHFVTDADLFKTNMQTSIKQLHNLDQNLWHQTAEDAGYTANRAHDIALFLEKNRTSINTDIRIMEAVVFQP